MVVGITGVAGFIGKYLTEALLLEGNTVIGWDIVEPNVVYDTEKFSFHYWNPQQPDDSELKKCDGVVNLAAKRPCGEFTLEDYFYNIDIAIRLIDSCQRLGIKNIVTISSRSVYSNSRMPWKEAESNTPVNLYGAAKAAVDDVIKVYNYQYGMHIKSLRLAQVLGLGERSGYLLNTFIDKAYKKETLEIWGTGNGKRQYIYVKDVVSAVKAALYNSDKGGVFNIGMPGNISIRELARVINHVFDNEGNYCIYEERREDIQDKEMDISRAREVLGWEAEYTITSALYDIKQILNGEENGKK